MLPAMKTIAFFLLTTAICGSLLAQKKPSRLSQWAGIYFNAMDATSPENWKNNVKGAPMFRPMTEHDFGFGFSYARSLNRNMLGLLRSNVLFHDYSATDRKSYSPKRNQLGIELEPSVQLHVLPEESLLNAFVSAGLGLGIYSRVIGAYLPMGVGISLTFDEQTRFVLQSQYRATLSTNVLKSNLLFSLGLMQRMDNNPQPKTAKLVLPGF
jgi:hypothetical protein